MSTFGVFCQATFCSLCFDVWDITSHDRFAGQRQSYNVGGAAAIVMFDVTSSRTQKHLPTWLRDLESVCRDAPIIVCGNKPDEVGGHPAGDRIRRDPPFECTISVQESLHLRVLFLQLATNLLTGEPGLEVVGLGPDLGDGKGTAALSAAPSTIDLEAGATALDLVDPVSAGADFPEQQVPAAESEGSPAPESGAAEHRMLSSGETSAMLTPVHPNGKAITRLTLTAEAKWMQDVDALSNSGRKVLGELYP